MGKGLFGKGRANRSVKDEQSQIEALWREAEGKGKGSGMKQPVGFNGSALWAILVTLIAGVIWIRTDFGPNFAGAAVLAVFGVLVFLAGQLTSIASRQVDGNQRIGELQATAKIEQERIKGENGIAKVDAQMRMKEFIFMLGLVKQMMGQQGRVEAQTPAPEENTIDLDAIRSYQWGDDDL